MAEEIEAPDKVIEDPDFPGYDEYIAGKGKEGDEPNADEGHAGAEDGLNDNNKEGGENKPEPPEAEPPVVVSEYWKTAAEKLGSQFQSEEEFLNEFKSGRDLKDKWKEVEPKLKEYETFSPTARDIDRAEKSGIDINLYLEARAMDVDKLGAKESLRKAYLLQKHGLIAAGKKDIVERNFEREYRSKYGILDEPQPDLSLLDDEQRQKRDHDLQDANDARELEVYEAKRTLAEYKQKHVSVPQAPKPEEQDKQFQQYLQDVDKSVNELKTLDVPVGNEVFKFGVDGYKEQIKKVLSSPQSMSEFFLSYGVDLSKGQIDPAKFTNLVLATYLQKDLGKPVSEWYLERNNAQTVKAKINDPAPAKPAPGGDNQPKDLDTQIAEAFTAQRKSQREQGKFN